MPSLAATSRVHGRCHSSICTFSTIATTGITCAWGAQQQGTFAQRQQDQAFCPSAEASSPEGDEGSAPLQLPSEHLTGS